ncbi:MAG: heparan-alpha-glucosaminide N-acetyltransferase domain-containing protein [Bacteroidia bacterium]|nr:heparan-alpha-glucosaminide N-acetyltransferase domain-containing protein [Bacteroidia bacterium]
MQQRIPGFDLARAYAIWGMFIVNFNVAFGHPADVSPLGQFLAFFNGNSSTLFVMLAGMGLSILARGKADAAARRALRGVILRRALFLFGAGLLLQLWWPADILHFYGVYMCLAAWLLFVPQAAYLWAALGAVLVFHLGLVLIPFETGWDLTRLQYPDFWTPIGFLRNTFYNGWNPVFPWLAFFLTGMYLGRLDWSRKRLKNRLFLLGAAGWLAMLLLQGWAGSALSAGPWRDYLLADYLPPTLPFMIGTASFSLMVLTLCVYAGEAWGQTRPALALAATGRMTLTHYVAHVTLGMILLAVLTGNTDLNALPALPPEPPALILGFSTGLYGLSVVFSSWWSRRFPHGPMEGVMRRVG